MTPHENLDTLDDATLRSIAYGRADSDTERMRAQRAARILADRGAHARGAEALVPAAAPAEKPASADARESFDDEPAGWWTRTRKIGAALLIGGLVLGIAAGLGGERLIAAATPASLSVFDREATEADALDTDAIFGSTVGESRLIGSLDDVRLYAVRVPGETLFGSMSLGPQVCAAAVQTGWQYFFPVCVPEATFAASGLSGAIGGIDTTAEAFMGPAPSYQRVIGIDWGPRGVPRISDITAEIRAATDFPYTDEQRAVGDDLLLTQALRSLPVDVGLAETLGNEGIRPTVGPALIQELSTEMLGSIVVFGTIAAPPGETPEVCLTLARSAIGARTTECVTLSRFRDEGILLTVEGDGGSSVVYLTPDAGTSISIEETIE